jgi:anthranilate synthase component II
MKILLLDNYDSFTYNLYTVGKTVAPDVEITVIRNDKISVEDVAAFDKIMLSPGPGLPKDAGIMPELIKAYAGKKPILGICLGHQAIGEAFGGSLHNLAHVYHGVATAAKIHEQQKAYVFSGLPKDLQIGRYHSWVVERTNLPKELIITAEDENGQIMGLRHEQYDIQGLQFHPESILTPDGAKMLGNWILN